MNKRRLSGDNRILRLIIASLLTLGVLVIVIRGCAGAEVTKGMVPGSDIADAVELAIKNGYEIEIGEGVWQLSRPLTFWYKTGFMFVGEGMTSPTANNFHTGHATRIIYTGPAAEFGLCFRGAHGIIGNFIFEDPNAALKTAILFTRPDGSQGIGSGKHRCLPMSFLNCQTGVQMGEHVETHNCDNCSFEWLEGDKCGSIYRSVTKQAMDNRIAHLVVRKCNRGVVMEGGNLVVHQGLVNQPNTTLCYCPPSKGMGPNNGQIVFNNLKIDTQALPGLQLVESENPSMIQFQFNGGQMPPRFEGTLFSLVGANSLTCRGFRSSYATITGKSDRGWGTPTILIESTMLLTWDDPATWFDGDYHAQVARCWTSTGKRVDWDSHGSPVDRIDQLEERLNGIKLEIPE